MTLHSSKVIPLINARSVEILSRFRERASAVNLVKCITDSVEQLGLVLSDFKGITTDAASVMRKVGEMLKKAAEPSPFYHQLCLAHGIHLAVLDTFKCQSLAKDQREDTGEPGAWHLVNVAEIDSEGIVIKISN